MSISDAWVPRKVGELLPDGALVGGYDSDKLPIYVGRTTYKGDVIPAKILRNGCAAYIGTGGSEHDVQDYEVLCDTSNQMYRWVKSSEGNVPAGLVPGGKMKDGQILYIGRVQHNGTLTVGTIYPPHDYCLYIGYHSKEIKFTVDYEILVYNK